MTARRFPVSSPTSDRRIGASRNPWALAQEIALQRSRIGKGGMAGGKSSPHRINERLTEELIALSGLEEAERLIAQAHAAASPAAARSGALDE